VKSVVPLAMVVFEGVYYPKAVGALTIRAGYICVAVAHHVEPVPLTLLAAPVMSFQALQARLDSA